MRFIKLSLGLIIWLNIGCSYKTDKEQRIEKAKQSIEISKNGISAISVLDLNTRQVVLADNEDKRMTPASLTKLFTTAAALEQLGPDYRFTTQAFLYSDNSKINIVVKGGGDPTLGSKRFPDNGIVDFFEKIKNSIKKNGLLLINGDIIIDKSHYSGPVYPSKRLWEDMANYYGASPSAVTYKENTFFLTLKSPKEIGQKCKVTTCSPQVNIRFDCLVKASASSKDSAYLYGTYNSKDWTIQGSIPASRNAFKIKGAMPDPGLVFGQELMDYLSKNGIKVTGKVTYAKPNVKKSSLIASHQSPFLSDIIKVINKKSQNLYADHLLFELGQQYKGNANWDTGCDALNDFWSQKINGFTGSFYDGSGLSPFNTFCCGDMVELLAYMNECEHAAIYKNSLAVGGVDGTLKRIWKDEDVKGFVLGKSGSMNGVLGYAGYFSSKNGKQYAFCIIVNHFTESFSDIRTGIEEVISELIRNN